MMEGTPRLSALLAGSVERAANAALALDPDTASRLGELEGRLVALHLDGPEVTLYLRAEGSQVRVSDASETQPETTVRGTPGALFAGALSEEGRRTAGRLHIEGDAQLGQAVERLARRLRPDWEEPLARAFGDIAGPRMARGLRDGAAWSRSAGRSLAEQAAEYLRDERRHLVSRTEMEEYVAEVDRLREAVDRLEARLTRLRPAGTGNGDPERE